MLALSADSVYGPSKWKVPDATGRCLAHTEKSCVFTGFVEIKSEAFSSLEVDSTPFIWPVHLRDSAGS